VCLLPSWTISGLQIHYSDDSFVPGNVTFSLTSSLTNTTEDIKCEVPFNYACRMNGTPKNKDLNLQLQFVPDTALAILNQTWVCADTPGQPTTPEWVIGTADITLTCPDPPFENMTCSSGTKHIINGAVWVQPKEEP